MVTASWSIGIIVGVPILLVWLGLCAVVIVLAGRSTDMDAGMVKGVAIAAFVITVLIAAPLYYPWKGEYHQWRDTTGTVAFISSRILGSSGSFQQKFVVRFTDGRERSCQDTRCALVRKGDRLTVTCKRQWQFAGRDGWDCNYVDDKRGSA